ncbi:MAG: thioredoxin family protein [Gammaproteobacteria bacterium]|nr:thioredoxin family protein [Gammaproteobacteria bacterium]|tara:strand:- start:622 stop:1173 length:552 start_codon:yes stop_codon:yes gene_type:complete
MSLTYSSMLTLGTELIPFNLSNTVSNKHFSSNELDNSKPSLIMFICNHCPYVIHYHSEIQQISKDYKDLINIVAISSNDVEIYPQDGPQEMSDLWEELGLSFPYLFDETQMIAKAYKAECTPESYLFDSNKKLVYRGRLDESTPNSNIQPSGKDIRNALDNLLNNAEIDSEQFPSMGCNIKWK